MKEDARACPLCGYRTLVLFFQDARRRYDRCAECSLISVHPEHFLSREGERAEYELHRNDPADPGYRRFLGRLFDPVSARLTGPGEGLDFGSGPGPTLSVMFKDAGHSVAIYDPFFAPDRAPLNRRYDFITASEVVEHLQAPGETLKMLWQIVRPGGLLGIMTKLARDREAFERWHYIRDSTHVCFFARETFQWLAQKWGAGLEFVGPDVVLLTKPGA